MRIRRSDIASQTEVSPNFRMPNFPCRSLTRSARTRNLSHDGAPGIAQRSSMKILTRNLSVLRGAQAPDLRGHYEIVFVAQIYTGFELDELFTITRQTQMFRDYDQMDLHLDSCKKLPNAFSRTCRKWEHCHWVPISRLTGFESIGIEFIRGFPKSWVPLDQVGRNIDFGSGGN